MSSPQESPPPSLILLLLLRLFAIVVTVAGLGMAVGGIRLALLGGSFYYLTVGTLIVIAGVLLFLRRRSGAWAYGLALAITVVWSIWEVGFDFWGLMPRLAMLSGFGLWLLTPWTQRPLNGVLAAARRVPLGATGAIVGGLASSVAIGGLAFTVFTQLPPDPRFQTGFGPFPEKRAAAYKGETGEDWPHFGGDRGGSRFTPLDQITPENVTKLEIAWQADFGELSGTNGTPLKIGDQIFNCNRNNEVYAISAVDGAQHWHYDGSEGYGGTCRGVTHYRLPGAEGLCASRIFAGTSMAKLVALDARTGALCLGFGDNGVVDLTKGIGDHKGEVIPGYYRVTSAPGLVRGKLVVGGWVTDNQYWGETSGVIRAFDAVTGELTWAWDLGNPGVHTEPAAGETYTVATPNSWAPMSADEELGLVYLPLGNATPDIFGANRRDFDEKFSSSVVALKAETGELAWSFQTLRHDLWDHDVASQPTLIDLPGPDGKLVPALVQPTKPGEIYVLNRVTGELLSDVTDVPVPQNGAVSDERLATTQPRSSGLPSFRGADLREADMWGLTPLDQLFCRIEFKHARYDGPQTPPGTDPAIYFPSTFGAINWGSAAVHPGHGVMVVNSNRFASYMQLVPREQADARGIKPAGPYISPVEAGGPAAMAGTPYAVIAKFWLSPLRMPCFAPPYGLISAVDLNTGKLLWTDRLGSSKDSGPLGLRFPFEIPMGTPTHGGTLITDTGIVFIGATTDSLLRAYDLRTGELLWKHELPGGGSSTPISYTLNGRQYVALMAGGSYIIGSRLSKKIVAFALPR